MKILITGANGMLGKALQKELIDHDVIQHTRYVSDLARVSEAWKFYKFVKDVQPDYVVHTAALVGGLNYNNDHPYEFMCINNMINGVVLDACIEAKVPRFLGMLSVCCYGDGFDEADYPLTEDKLFDKKPHPTNAPYAYSKRQLAKAIEAANKEFGLRYNYLIPTNLYGVHDSRGEKAHFCSFMIDNLLDAVKNNKPDVIFTGDPMAKRQYILVDDLAKVIRRHIELDLDANYNVASKEELCAEEMINNLNVSCGNRKNIIFTNRMVAGQNKRTVSTQKFYSQHPNFEFVPFYEGAIKVYRAWQKTSG